MAQAFGSFIIFRFTRFWFCERMDTIHGGSLEVKAVWRESHGILLEGRVSNIGYRFRHGTEGGRQLHPTHSARHGDGHTWFFSGALWKDDGQAKAVTSSEEHLVESVLNVMLGQLDWAELRVCMASQFCATVENPTKLHGLGGCMRDHGGVHRHPGVVAEELRSAVTFIFDCMGEQELRQVLH